MTIQIEMNNKLAVEKDNLVARLALLHQAILDSGDTTNAEKTLELLQKVNDELFIVGFCGHFSAGKSSLINELFADGALPTSPIPTSANIVKLKAGDPLARVFFTNGSIMEFAYPYNLEDIKRYCIDGETVRTVELQLGNGKIPPHVSIFDTPGIDSTDDAHRLATESVLHLADVVFYVMDYNHVQSELNFAFTKELQDRGVTLYLIVNQVDKHRDEELSFAAFKNGVEDAFLSWNVRPKAIYYTSLHNDNEHSNDIFAIKEMLQTLFQNKNLYIHKNAISAAQCLIEDHVNWLQENEVSNMQELAQSISTLAENEIIERIESLEAEQKQLLQAPMALGEEIQAELQKILHNSSLTPYETRELAMKFLESTQPNFKVGFLFTEKKTDEERAKRLEQFMTDIKAKAAAQISWHIKAMLINLLEKYKIHDDALVNTVQSFDVTIDAELFKNAVKKDAKLGGDYLLNYTKEVSDKIKAIYRKKVLDFSEMLQKYIADLASSKLKNINDTLSEIAKHKATIDALNRSKAKIAQQKSNLLTILSGDVDVQQVDLDRFTIKNYNQSNITRITSIQNEISPNEPQDDLHLLGRNESNMVNTIDVVQHYTVKEQMKEMAHQLQQAAQFVSKIPGFVEDVKEMQGKAKRLEQFQFTVALFGAFSAGKSSFANALLGNNLLPTSPNPTTAAITKIMPVTSQYTHETLRVKIKSKEDLFSDLNHALQFFHLHAKDFDDLQTQIEKINALEISAKLKPYFSFLKAFEKGCNYYSQLFGQIIETTVHELEPFVAQEEKAAFVEWIEIYYDLPLTSQGITLVDTPGADSIHSRHTGVAFDYIKNADALIYVTYYNHAFSQADKEFLLQLGRVKDTFEMDKMFFIINAIDLAKSADEIALVKQHVEQNLLAHGIRNARIYPVSSKTALSGKIDLEKNNEIDKGQALLNTSGFTKFEHDFMQFSLHELVGISMQSAKKDIERTLFKLNGYIEQTTIGEEEREKRLQQVIELHQLVKTKLHQFDLRVYEQSLTQEMEELFYYVKQRMNLRQRDTFKIAFSPAVLRKDSDIKQQLRSALQEWLRSIEVDVVQEMRATTLRIEKYIRKAFAQIESKLVENILANDPNVVISQWTGQDLQTPTIHEDYSFAIEPHVPILSMFKSQKQFFEQNGNQAMLEKLQLSISEPLSGLLRQYFEEFIRFYRDELYDGFAVQLEHIESQVSQYYEGEMAALSMKMDIETLHHTRQQLLAILHNGK